MTDIAEHDSEKEGETDNGKETRIDFTITRHTIGINETLEARGKLVGTMVRRRCFLCREFCQN